MSFRATRIDRTAARVMILLLVAQLSCLVLFARSITEPVAIFSDTPHSLPDTSQTAILQREIDKLQQEISAVVKLKLPVGSPDFQASQDAINKALIVEIDSIQLRLEDDENKKLTALKKWRTLLGVLSPAIGSGALLPGKIPELISSFQQTLEMVAKKQSVFTVIKQNEVSIGRIILNALVNDNIEGLDDSKEYLVSETFERDPANFFATLFEFPGVSCADSLLIPAARKMPEDLYNYSQATASQLGQKILASKDSLIGLISGIAQLPQGRLYFPFLDDLYHKRISFNIIKNTLGEDRVVSYYQLLIKTITGYNERRSLGDTAISFKALTNRIDLTASYDFIRVINSLHEYNDDVRLKVIEKLSAKELYYLCISGVNDLYTSSYLKIYRLIISRNSSLNSYLFLKNLQFDQFKRFLKMASTFNTLDDFLGRMKKEQSDTLMHAFIDGLNEKSSIEDAVYVADSYASIHNQNLRSFILKEIQNKTGPAQKDVPASLHIYAVLNTLFQSLDSSNHINLTSTLGIADVYRVPNNFLKDDSGRIIIQQFFYGDQDGQYAFAVFLNSFRNGNWKIVRSKYWVELVSKKGIPVHLYANLPLDDNTNQAEYAQQMLSDYLMKKNTVPSIIIHRGHSYHLNNTLKLLSPANKLIFLGSCGGYNQLKQVYKVSPTAQIVATKQEGSIIINQPLINYVTYLLVSGQNLDWPAIWNKMALQFKGDSRFRDYVPPYQNLGAILLMALNKPGMQAK